MSGLTSQLPSDVLLACLAILVIRCAVLANRWRIGQRSNSSLLSGLMEFPRRYLREVHEVVAREPRSARMHANLAGGILAALLFIGLPELLGLASAWTAAIGIFFLIISLFGLLLQARRRLPQRPARLSAGPFQWLTPAFGGGVIFLAWVAMLQFTDRTGLATPTIVAAILGFSGLGLLAWTASSGPMRHAAAGFIALSAHPRPERFQGGASTDLRALDLDGEYLGVERPGDFGWNRLASFDACIQCGRCEAACPAFAASQPLNPKKLINDIASALAPAGTPQAYAGSPHPGVPLAARSSGPLAPLVVDTAGEWGIAPETLWSCTTCRACVQECPMMIEHVDAVVELRRFQTMEKGALVGKAGEALTNLRMTDTVSGRGTSSRLDWAADLGIPLISEGGQVDMLLWLGEGAFDLRNQRSLRAFVTLLKKAGASFATLGMDELDTGDLARRLGDEATFQRLASENIAALKRYRFNRIVTLDPHVLHALRNEYPALGGRWSVSHHSSVLSELLAAQKLSVTHALNATVTYHDPCYLGRYNREFEAPRAVLNAAGVTLVEMERSGLRSSCCGGGGGAPLTDIPGTRRIPDVRMDHARETGAAILAVGCPFCAQMMEGVVGRRPDVKDLAELLLEAVEEPA